jgi:hypothetical protein
MRMALEKYIPDGETLLAGIHAIAKETNIIGIFDKCICTEYSLRPDENGGMNDIGTCYNLTDIQKCEIKKGWMGSVKCNIAMKNGTYFKLLLPKLGGLGGDMPNHTQYRDAIIARLGGGSI